MIKLTLSGGRDRWRRVVVRPVQIRGEQMWQVAYRDDKREYHKNGDLRFKNEELARLTSLGYKTTTAEDVESLEHDKIKKWILPVGTPVDFLIELGVQTKEGKIVVGKYDKFVQVNEFLKHLNEVIKTTKLPEKITVVDLGCGNAYLTLATYYYFQTIKIKKLKMIGVDAREDIIDNLKWKDIEFVHARIGDYKSDNVDIVMALHACDTATDDALKWAVEHEAKIILAAPCCQHYLQKQMKAITPLSPIFREPVFKQRLGDILTDVLRVVWLKTHGYASEAIEFVETKHTPKNVLIKPINSPMLDKKRFAEEYKQLINFWQVEPYVERIYN